MRAITIIIIITAWLCACASAREPVNSLNTQRSTNLSARLLNRTDGSAQLTGAEWAFLSKTFLKCTRWQVEETMDTLNCPYHYYCNSAYPGNYPVVVDWLALALWAVCGLLLAGTLLWEFLGDVSGRGFNRSAVRYCLPSGPAVLPLVLLVLAKGLRINSLFPLSYAAPALLQMLHISALGAPGTDGSKSLNAVVLEMSSASGILHASLYVESVSVPYYTGLEALVSSSMSGICSSCVCRREPLVAGGRFLSSGGAWSHGSLAIASALLGRLACGLLRRRKRRPRRCAADVAGAGLECLAWAFAIRDVTALATNPPLAQRGLSYDRGLARPLLALLLLALSKRFWNLWVALGAGNANRRPPKDESAIP